MKNPAAKRALPLCTLVVAAATLLASQLPATAAQAEIKELSVQGGLKDGKGRLTIEADLTGLTGRADQLIFATTVQHSMHANLEKITHLFRVNLEIMQGQPKEIPLTMGGEGTIRQVTGDQLLDWSVRQEPGGARVLVLRWKNPESATNQLSAIVEAETKLGDLPETISPLTLAPPRAALFSGFVRVDYEPSLHVQSHNLQGLVPVEEQFLPEPLRAQAVTNTEPIMYRFQGSGYSARLTLNVGDPEARRVMLRNFQLSGQVEGERARFTLRATASVKNPKGGKLELLSGDVALTEFASDQGWRIELDQGRYVWVTEKAGEYALNFTFDAAVRTKDGSKTMNFKVAGSALKPVRLHGLAADTQFQPGTAAKPEREGPTFVSYLPASGEVSFTWKEARAETEGRLFYSADMLTQIAISPGLMRQHAVIDFRVMQGELNRVSFLLSGEGEVTRVQGTSLLAWNVEAVPNSSDRRIVVQLNQPQRDSFSLQVQLQTPLGTFPQAVSALQLRPENAIRLAGYMRVINEGAVRLEVLEAAGMSQVSPDQFPQTDVTRALWPTQGSQRFAFRFSGPQQQLRIQADNILPELSVAHVLAYRLGETELTIEAETEVEIREAPVRELLLRIPKGYAIARLTASNLSDYFTRDEEGSSMAELRLVFGQPVSGRQAIQLRLERNNPLTEAQWELPVIELTRAKSVRGHVGVSSDAGFRLTPVATEGLTDIATAFFPKKAPNLQVAFRITDPAWRATLRVERLPQTIQADAMHLFSIGEGVAYGSTVINYVVSGAPVSGFRVELSAEYFNVEFIGRDVRAWQKTGTVYQVQLHTPVAGAYPLLITYERPFKAQGDTLGFSGARTLDTQSEQGHTLVISAHQFQVKPVNVSTSLLPLEPAEVPAEYRLLFDAPLLAAYRYTARPFNLQLQLSPLAQAETVGQVVDRAALTTRISKEGQILTDARYFIKNHGEPHFRLVLPEGMQLWSAMVNGANVSPVRDGATNLVPLPQRADANKIQQVEVKIASRSKSPDRVSIFAPIVKAPVLLAQWTLNPDTRQRLVYRRGNLTPAEGTADYSGFAGLVRLFTGHRADEAVPLLAAALGLVVLALLLARWTPGPGVYRFSARHIAGAVVVLIASVLALGMFLMLAEVASREARSLPDSLTFLAPVQQSGSALRVDVWNRPAEMRAWDYLVLGLPLLLAIVVWVFGWMTSRTWLRLPALIAGWLILFWGVLRAPNSSPAFFVVTIIFLTVHVIWPAFRRLRGLPRKPTPSTTSSGPAAAAATAAILLLLGAGGISSAAPTPKPPALASSVLQEIRVENEAAYAQAKVLWRAIRGQTLPLLYEPAVLTRITYPTNALKFVPGQSDGKQAHLLVAQENGEFEVRFEYQLSTSSKESERGLQLPTRHGLVNQVRLLVAGMDVDVVSPQAVSVARETSGTNTVAGLVLTPVDNSWIAWKPRARDPSREKVVFYAELAHLYVPTAGLIEGLHQVQIRPAQGELTELVFDVPAGAAISEVTEIMVAAAQPGQAASTRAPIVSLWRFDPDARKLRVSLRPTQTRPFTLLVRSQVATGSLPFEQEVGVLSVNGAAGQVGLIGVATGAEVQLDSVATGALSAINLEDFPANLTQAAQIHAAGLTVRRAFRYQAIDSALTVKASAVQPDVRVETQDTLSLGEDRTVFAANWNVTITRAGIFRLSFLLPTGLDIETVSGGALSHWTELKTAAGRLITLHLKGKTEGQQQFALSLTGPGVRPTNGWVVPRVAVREASKQQGQLMVVPEQGLKLQVGTREGLTQLDPTRAGVRQKGVLAFRILQADWQLTLDLEQLAPWVQVTTLQHVTLAEAQLRIAANLLYQIENTGLKTLRVFLPTNAETVRFTGEQVADFIRRETGTNGTAWEVKLHRRVIGKYRLQTTFQIRIPEGARTAEVTGIFAESADLHRGFVTVQTSGRLQARVDDWPTALQPTEWQAIPGALQEGLQATSANYSFRVVEPRFRLVIQLVRHEAARLLPARVNRATLTSVISDDGEMLTQVSLDMTPGDKRLLRLRLPAGARFWFAFVNQHSAWPWREQEEVLIPLEHQAKAGQTMPVEVFFSSQVGSPQRRNVDLTLAGPKFDLPLENITWRVFLSQKWRLQDWSGTLQLNEQAEQPTSVALDLQSYLQNEMQMQQGKTREAEQLLVLGNQLLERGDPQQARRAFENAYGISQHDAAFNEDARVQLNNLKVQQALLGLNVRRDNVAGAAAPGTNVAQVFSDEKKLAYTQQQAREILDRNTAEEKAAFTRVAERIIQQQDAAIAKPGAIRATIPEQGRQLVFSRAIQVDPFTDMRINLEVAPARTASGGRRTLLLLLLAVGLGVLIWAGRALRRNGEYRSAYA